MRFGCRHHVPIMISAPKDDDYRHGVFILPKTSIRASAQWVKDPNASARSAWGLWSTSTCRRQSKLLVRHGTEKPAGVISIVLNTQSAQQNQMRADNYANAHFCSCEVVFGLGVGRHRMVGEPRGNFSYWGIGPRHDLD